MKIISSVASWDAVDGIAVLTLASPPVNALSAPVRQGILRGLEAALEDNSIDALVLRCEGRTFFAGADISEFGKPPVAPDLNTLVTAIDGAPKPVIAAIHGTALGGGLELALACHGRVAAASAKLGLPEVNLGLLPGAGGTQRLPRLVGVSAALEMMLTGRPISAPAALDNGLIDVMVDDGLLYKAALAAARGHATKSTLRRVSELNEKIAEARMQSDLFGKIEARHARLFRGFKAPAAILAAVHGAIDLPFAQGMARERELFLALVNTSESAAQRYAFFAEREAARIPNLAADTPVDVRRVGVVGAGTMGTGIAMNFLDIGMPVTLVERQQDALDRGVAAIRQNYALSASKGRIRAEDIEARLSLLRPSLELQDLADRELVIEAVFEDMELKKQIFAQLAVLVAPDAILASNTSFLDLNAIAAAISRPERVVGMHFFSPANVMRLLEVVRGEKSAPSVIAAVLRLGRRIGKVTVVSGVCHGFIANRMMSRRSAQASALILEGPMPWDVDRVMREFGFAMGPFSMMDLVGLDVVGWNRQRSSGSTVQELLCERGRWGIKRGAGYYDYDSEQRATPSSDVAALIKEFAVRSAIEGASLSDAAILERLLYPVVNEGARILEEGIAIRASDIDIALITGYGWPVYTGGPMFWAGTVGLRRIVASLKELQSLHGEAFRPAALLERLATEGRTFRDL